MTPLARLRLAIFALCALGLIGPPFYRQVLRGKDERFRDWQMYGSTGSGAVVGRFERVAPDGSHHPLAPDERLALVRRAQMDSGEPDDLPTWTWRIRSDGQLDTLVAKTCRAIHRRYGPTQYVVMSARRASRQGWEPVEWGSRNACLERPRRSRARPPTKEGS